MEVHPLGPLELIDGSGTYVDVRGKGLRSPYLTQFIEEHYEGIPDAIRHLEGKAQKLRVSESEARYLDGLEAARTATTSKFHPVHPLRNHAHES